MRIIILSMFFIVQFITAAYIRFDNPDMNETRLFIEFWHVWSLMIVCSFVALFLFPAKEPDTVIPPPPPPHPERPQMREVISDGVGWWVLAHCTRCKQKSMTLIRPGVIRCGKCRGGVSE